VADVAWGEAISGGINAYHESSSPEHRRASRTDATTQAEVQALRDKAEELADDLRALSTLTCRPKPRRRLIHSLRTAAVAVGASGEARRPKPPARSGRQGTRCRGRWLGWGAGAQSIHR
jgi:hypothetical protein